MVTYTCNAGYYFNHQMASTTATIRCQNTGQWTPLSEDCTGDCLLVYTYMLTTKALRKLHIFVDEFVTPFGKRYATRERYIFSEWVCDENVTANF